MRKLYLKLYVQLSSGAGCLDSDPCIFIGPGDIRYMYVAESHELA